MKKIGAIIIAVLMTATMLLGIVGCGNGTQNDDSNDPPDIGQELPKKEKFDGIYGEFHSMDVAYNKGYITKTNIMDSAYYYSGVVYDAKSIAKWDERVKLDYTPTKPAPEFLKVSDSDLENKIKSSYFELYKYKFYYNGELYCDATDLSVYCYGEYDKTYILRIEGPGYQGDVSCDKPKPVVAVLTGVGWYDNSSYGLTVFRLK